MFKFIQNGVADIEISEKGQQVIGRPRKRKLVPLYATQNV
jgi:hypothetical protein